MSLIHNQFHIFSVGEKRMGSAVDPILESQKWLTLHQKEIEKVESIVILGAGSGYHIAGLAKLYPEKRICCFEKYPESIEFAKKNFPLETAAIEFIKISTELNQYASENFDVILQRSYAVVDFMPAQFDEDLIDYQNLREFLLGRSEQGLQFILSKRPDLLRELLLSNLRLAESGLVSIKTLGRMIIREPSMKNGLLLSALGELVK